MASYPYPVQLREFAPKNGATCRNTSSATIPARRVCKYVAGGANQAIALATDPADLFAGVSDRAIEDGDLIALRIAGRVICEVGAQVVEGDRLTPDSQGRLVPAVDGEGVGVAWMAIAMTSAATAGELIEAELRLSGGDGEGP